MRMTVDKLIEEMSRMLDEARALSPPGYGVALVMANTAVPEDQAIIVGNLPYAQIIAAVGAAQTNPDVIGSVNSRDGFTQKPEQVN
jgi:hypothetical protein